MHTPNITTILRTALHLAAQTMLKTVVFQLIFKVLYATIIIFLLHLLISTFLDAFLLFVTQIYHNTPLKHTDIGQFVGELRLTVAFFLSFFGIIYIHHIEKNGVLLIVSGYKHRHFISTISALYRSIITTPRFLLRRIRELHIFFLLFFALYILHRFFVIVAVDTIVTRYIAVVFTLYCIGLFYAVMFRNAFTAHMTFLAPREHYRAFNARITKDFLYKRFHILCIFYGIFCAVVLCWMGVCSLLVHYGVGYVADNPHVQSSFIAATASCMIVSAIMFFMLFRTLRTGIDVVLFDHQRRCQHKSIPMHTNTKTPFFARHIYIASVTLLCGACCAAVFLFYSVQKTTDYVATQKQVFQEMTFGLDDITIEEILAQRINTPHTTFVEKMERGVLIYLLSITQ